MPRTISTAQADVLASNKYAVHARVEVANSTGGMVNLSNLSTADWVRGISWDWELDQPVPQMTLQLARDNGSITGQSLAPLNADSTFNLNSTNGYMALVFPGRALDVYTACTTPGGSVTSTSQWDFIFQGEIDDVNWESSPMTCVVRSKIMSRVRDRWIESSSYNYGNSTGQAVATVIENIMDDWTDLSTTTLLSTSPAFYIAPVYSPDKQSVFDAINANAMLPGFALQEVWSTASTSWRLKLYEPDRSATSSDTNWTIGPQSYYDVLNMSVSRRDVRNRISILYGGSTSRAQVIVQSTSSQDAYGVQFMELEEAINSAITTSSEASTLVTAALNDLKEPYATHEIEMPYYYPVEIGDVMQFDANNIHYSSNQYLAVVGIMHTLNTQTTRTRLKVRGKPAGQVAQWFHYHGGGNSVLAEVLSADVSFSLGLNAVVAVVAEDLITANVYITVGDGSAPADPTAASNHGSLTGARGTITSSNAVTVGANAYVKVVAADAAGVLGPVVQIIAASAAKAKDTATVDDDGATAVARKVQSGTVFGTSFSSGYASVSFPQTYDTTPSVKITSSRVLTYSSAAGALTNQEVVVDATDISGTGCTLRALLLYGVTTSADQADFAAGNDLDVVGETAECNLGTLAPAGAYGDTYTIHYSVDFTATASAGSAYSVTVVVAFDSNDGGGWVERTTANYFLPVDPGTSDSLSAPNESVVLTVSGLTTNDDLRIRLKSITETGSGSYSALDVHGFNLPTDGDPFNGVTWLEQTGSNQVAAATAAQHFVAWESATVT